MSYRNLEIWKIAREVAIHIHQMTLSELPKLEMYEEGSQIRRSSKSIRSNIVEGYGRRRYKQEFIKHLVYAQASCDETVDHLETLHETGSLNNPELLDAIGEKLDMLGRKLNLFIQSVEQAHQSVK
jgi:four helix bundle protein